MTTPTLSELRANLSFTPFLHRALRIDQALADLGPNPSEQQGYKELTERKISRIQDVGQMIQLYGIERAQAHLLAVEFLTEMHQLTTPDERRALMSLDEAMGT